MKYFLDTNTCVFIINNKFPHLSRRFLECNKNTLKIPSVALFELYYGAEKSQRREQNISNIQTFISEIDIIPFDSMAAEIAGIIRSDLERAGKIIGGNDLMIAATALANSGTIVTNNIGEFSRVNNLPIEDWSVC